MLAARHDVPFYVAAPLSTIDPATPDGSAIPIEDRDPSEVAETGEAFNPAFYVTPAELVSAIVTEAGVLEAPYPELIARAIDARGVTDADDLLSRSRRPLVLGIGGGGDVVGALATAEACRVHGAEPMVGGVTWERRPIDRRPGPRAESEIEGARSLAPGVMAASGDTRVRESGVLFAESRMAEMLGEETVLVDATLGPAQLSDGIAAAAASLGVDLIVFVDVGGDALAHGDEPGWPARSATPFSSRPQRVSPSGGASRARRNLWHRLRRGALRPSEVLERLAEVGAAGGLAGARGHPRRRAAD